MSRYFSLEFGDLSYEKRQDLIEEVKKSLLEEYEVEGLAELKKAWHKPEPKSWQEAYIRVYGIQHNYWDEYEDKIEGAEEPDWNNLVEEYAEKEAESKCYKGMHHMEIEVEV